MSGHSHWSGIKHKKAKEDKIKGKAFSRAAKGIISAARRGGKNPATNLALQYAIEEARAVNMPKETVERAILKGAGELEGQQLESVRYEGYGAGGAAVIVEALTDNRNRTTPHVRKMFEAHAGKLGASGCVSWLFQTKGLFILNMKDKPEAEVEKVFDLAVEAGAEDFQKAGDFYELISPPAAFQGVMEALKKAGIKFESSQITEVPSTYVDLGVEDGRKILKMMEELESDEDVSAVYSNFNLPDELVTEMGAE